MECFFSEKGCHNLLNRYLEIPPSNPGEILFAAIFEEEAEFRRPFTLPFNTLVGVLEDGGVDNSPIRDLASGEEHGRGKNWLYFTPYKQRVFYETHSNLRYIAVHFNLELYPGIDAYAGEKNWIFEYSPENVKRLEQAFQTEEPILRLSRIREFCLWFCNRHWPNAARPDMRRERFGKVLVYIREHGTARTTVGELAGMMNLRFDAFSREFAQAFGRPPKEFLQNELSSKAAALLLTPECNVKETANRLEFSSEFYFSKFFKRRIGCSPADFRKQYGTTGKVV